jgi:hypothetical protein
MWMILKKGIKAKPKIKSPEINRALSFTNPSTLDWMLNRSRLSSGMKKSLKTGFSSESLKVQLNKRLKEINKKKYINPAGAMLFSNPKKLPVVMDAIEKIIITNGKMKSETRSP